MIVRRGLAMQNLYALVNLILLVGAVCLIFLNEASNHSKGILLNDTFIETKGIIQDLRIEQQNLKNMMEQLLLMDRGSKDIDTENVNLAHQNKAHEFNAQHSYTNDEIGCSPKRKSILNKDENVEAVNILKDEQDIREPVVLTHGRFKNMHAEGIEFVYQDQLHEFNGQHQSSKNDDLKVKQQNLNDEASKCIICLILVLMAVIFIFFILFESLMKKMNKRIVIQLEIVERE